MRRLVLLVAGAAVVAARRALRVPRVRNTIHVALGRPIMAGVDVERGTVVPRPGAVIADCTFTAPDRIDRKAVAEALSALADALGQGPALDLRGKR